MSQRSAPLPAGHPVKALQGLSRAIALPHEYPPARLPSFPALERTAVMGFSVPVSLTIPASSTIKVATMRQASYPCWAELASTHGNCAMVTYRCAPIDGNSVTTVNANTFPLTLYSSYVSNGTATSDRIGLSGISNNDWLYPPIGMDSATGQLPWVYVPTGCTVSLIVYTSGVLSATNAVVATMSIDKWTGPGEAIHVLNYSVTIAANTTGKEMTSAGAVSVSGWLRPRVIEFSSPGISNFMTPFFSIVYSNATSHTYATSNSNSGTLTLSGLSTNKLLTPLVYPIEYANSILPWQSTRTTATAALFTNVTQVLNKGGTVLAGRGAPAGINGSMWSASETFVSNLHPAEKAYLGLETGHYTYVPPSTDLATFWDYSYTPQQTGSLPLVRLDNDSLFNVAFFTASSVDEQLACTVDWHIEFRTTSTLFQIGLCPLTLETMHQAQVALAAVGYFFENFNHKAILGWITDNVRRYGPAALGLVPHPVARAASMILSSAPKPPPPTTAAATAGMLGPKARRRSRPAARKKVRVQRKKRV